MLAAGAAAKIAPAPLGQAGMGEQMGFGDAPASANYFVDSLFRHDLSVAAPAPVGTAVSAVAPAAPAQGGPAGQESRMEAAGVFIHGLHSGALPLEDAKYLGQMVASRAGIPQADAEKRVADAYAKMQAGAQQVEAKAREAADAARKASAYSALWIFVSLLAGPFVASLSATAGGRRRDL